MDMYPYIPKLSHAMITTALLLLCLAVGGWTRGRMLLTANVGALVFAIMTAIIMWMLIVQTWNESVDRIIRLAEIYGKLDDEARAALAFQFPAMRYVMKRGQVREMFEDTNATIEQFRTFLKTSNEKYISPERDWSTTEMPRWAWLEIKGWLEDQSYIIPDSAAGSHSWLWNGNAYRHLMAYWLAGRRLVNMSEQAA